jgi:preprotein translocase subunit SecE
MSSKLFGFFTEVQSEAKKVSWPGKAEINSTVLMVMGVVLVASIFFSVIDLAAYKLISFMLKVGR